MRQLEHAEHVPAPHHGRHVEAVLAGLKDPLNVGQAFRLADALGVRRLVLAQPTPTPPNAKLNRTARGAQHRVTWASAALPALIDQYRDRAVYTVAIECASASRPLVEVAAELRHAPVALFVGNEAHGLPGALLEACDYVAHLPMYGSVSSYNVSTALAIALWEFVRA